MSHQRSLKRFLNPESVALFGGGWSENVIQQLLKSGYRGKIWPVHPKRDEICGIKCFSHIKQLPDVPDASFVGVNRDLTYEVVSVLSSIGAGGAICFASGFREAEEDKNLAQDRQALLVKAAGDMPILGPNCYGFINYLDNITLWPDQHGGTQCDRGVAIIAQSSNIAINMTMQQRGLKIAYMLTLGNQAQTDVSELVETLLDDARVSTIGLYLESFNDIRAFEKMAERAWQLDKSIVVLKVGKSLKAQMATVTHTASLAGNAASSTAFLKRLGLIVVDSIAVFLETLKLLDNLGPLKGSAVASVSCSGGEASLMADLAMHTRLDFKDFSQSQITKIHQVLGDKVTLANPLDYHTYIWGDVKSMTDCFSAVMQETFDLVIFVLDLPRKDHCDVSGHECAIESIIAAKKRTGANVAVLSSLTENLDEQDAHRFIDAGIVPLHGMEEGIAAINKAIVAGQLKKTPPHFLPVLLDKPVQADEIITSMDEYQAKTELAKFGLNVPQSVKTLQKSEIMEAASTFKFPLVLKGLGFEHKTESGVVFVGLHSSDQLEAALNNMPDCPQGYFLEEMLEQPVAELIIGVTRDETGLFLMTIGAGGIYTEILTDTVSVLLPSTSDEIFAALKKLKIYKVLVGYRGQAAADLESIIGSITAVSAYVEKNQTHLCELDINPLFVGTDSAIAVDALIRTY